MKRREMIDYIINYYNEHFKWQRLVMDEEIDRTKIEALTDEELKAFIEKNCR